MQPFAFILFAVGAVMLVLSFMAMHRRRKRNKRRSRPINFNTHTHCPMRRDFDDDIGFLSSSQSTGSETSSGSGD